MTDDTTLFDFDPSAQAEDEKTIEVCHVAEPFDIYGGRAKGGIAMGDHHPPKKGWLGNPYRVTDYGREHCIKLFEADFYDRLRESRDFCNAVLSLMGKRVACHCRRSDESDGKACHLDIVRHALLDGHVQRIAHDVHDITLTDKERGMMCDPEDLL